MMAPSLVAHRLLVAAVVIERLVELAVARRNDRWLRARGAVEIGRAHYPVMVALHASLLAGSVLEPSLLRRRFAPTVAWPALAVVLASQALRWWCVATLGRRWTTRILVLPGAPRVRAGPYRVMRHPNYAAVAAEGAALPLVHGAWITSLLFTAANAALLLGARVRTEDLALGEAEAAAKENAHGANRDRIHPGRARPA